MGAVQVIDEEWARRFMPAGSYMAVPYPTPTDRPLPPPPSSARGKVEPPRVAARVAVPCTPVATKPDVALVRSSVRPVGCPACGSRDVLPLDIEINGCPSALGPFTAICMDCEHEWNPSDSGTPSTLRPVAGVVATVAA